MKRPTSLAEVARSSRDPRTFHLALADFLDEFFGSPSVTMLSEEPLRLARTFTDGEVADAYLAAVAASLARLQGVSPPRWSGAADRTLAKPWFASPGPAVRAMLLLESPAPFRERNLFVSANALGRA